MKNLSLLLAFGLLVACGGDDDAPATKEISDPQVEMAGENTGKSSLTLTALPPSADEAAGTQAVTLVGNAMTAFAGQHQSYSATQVQGLVQQALESPADNHEQIEFSYENGRLLADINITSSPQASIRYKADLTIDIQGADSTLTATIDGTLNINVTSGTEGFTSSVIYDGRFTALKFDAAACATDPISGTITVDYDVQSGGASIPGASVGGLVEAVFGPNCGDLSVTGT